MNCAAPSRLSLRIEAENWPLRTPFRITGYTVTDLDALVVTLDDGTHRGRGEAAGVYYHDDDPPRMAAQIEAVRGQIEAGLDRDALARLLPRGGARNAVDCALWDLEARRSGRPAWALAGLEPPRPLLTTYTLGADAPEVMAAGARAFVGARALKLKLTGEAADIERVRAVRAARPDVWIGVDANQGFTPATLTRLMPALVESGVGLLEQPFPLDRDIWLDGLCSPIPVAADESVQGLDDIAGLVGRADVINIKLDKCGGLTEGLAMAREARRLGLGVMVGNMLGTALAMAPAFVLGQLCDIVDLDGPIPLASDRDPPTVYEDGRVWCAPEIWGAA
ncbi:dipeptide epimerase [Phenylobacterium sp.]|uniref:dipeptide epimerase n=1 Tax=Phenylobacterium sp. TaxID=1871053 RepID=UPI002FC8ED3E